MTTVSRKGIRRAHSPLQPTDREAYINLCLTYLDTALFYAKQAGAPYLVNRLKLARSSALGAKRNAGYRVTRERQERQERAARS